jgi:uncharacterized protein YggE
MLEQRDRVKYGLWAVAVLALAYVAYQYGQSVNSEYSSRTFTVEGSAKLASANNIATFAATVYNEGGMDQAEVQRVNTEKMNQVVAYIKSQGIEDKDIKTDQYALNPKYSAPNCVLGGTCDEPKIIGYTATQNVTVKVRKTEDAGKLVAGVVQNGATSVGQVQFTPEDNSADRDAARVAALKDAERKAKDLAVAGNFRIGKLITFYEQGQDAVGPYPMMGVAKDSMSAGVTSAPAPALQPGTTEDEVRVTVTYEIK